MLKAQLANAFQFAATRGNMVCDCCMPHSGATLASQLARDAADAAADALAERGGRGPREGEPVSLADLAAEEAKEASTRASAAAALNESRLFFFSNHDIALHAPQEFDAYFESNLENFHCEKEEQARKEAARKIKSDEFAGFGEAEKEERARDRRVTAHRNAIIEQILTPRCPTCHVPFEITREFADSFVLFCVTCVGGRRFCAYCSFDAGTDASVAHDHVAKCPLSLRKGSYFPPTDRPACDSFNQARAPNRKAQIQTYLDEQVTADDRPLVVAVIARNCSVLGVTLDP